jgi:hypothetical protein
VYDKFLHCFNEDNFKYCVAWLFLRFPKETHIVGTCNCGTECIIFNEYFFSISIKVNEQYVTISHIHEGYVGYAAVLIGTYLPTFQRSLLPIVRVFARQDSL